MEQHRELDPIDEKPSWTEIVAAFFGVLALVGLIVWNHAEKKDAGAYVQIAERQDAR